MTFTPEALVIEEKLPADAVQETPLFRLSLTTVADMGSGCVTVRPARTGETERLTVPEAIVRVSVTDLVCWGIPESRTSKVRDALVTDWVGVPVIVPAEALSMSPVGSAPLVIDQVSAGVPPVAVRVAL